MPESAFLDATVALAVGMAAQALAERLAAPSIVVLLAAGAAVGPDGLGLLDPHVFGRGRADLVTFAVTVILFEGGLALDLARLRQVQRALLGLLTWGSAVSLIVGMLAARLVLGVGWPVALLYGAIMIITGPTVVTPLLARLNVDREVRDLLVSEGVLIDPIGAVVAIVLLDYVLGGEAALQAGWLVILRLVAGGAAGVLAGVAVAALLRRQWIAVDLVNPVVLSAALLTAACASALSPDAGLMAAVTAGATLANLHVPDIGRMRQFKETLTVILLSFIFVVLAADVRLAAVVALGWPGVAVVAIVAWVGRPLAVLAATAGTPLGWRQRLFLSWICPRGIVAAAVAGLFSLLLADAGIPGGSTLEALVFLTIALTVTVQGLTARRVAHLLHVDAPSMVGVLVVGADHLGRLLALLLQRLGRQVALVDRSPTLCRAARARGLPVYEGDALALETLEEAGARFAGAVVALTRNYELNTLVTQRVRDNFRVEHLLALTDAETAAAGVPKPFPGHFPGADDVNVLLRRRRVRIARYDVPDDAAPTPIGDLPYGEGECALLVERDGGVLIAATDQTVVPGDKLWCLRPDAGETPLAARFAEHLEPAPAV